VNRARQATKNDRLPQMRAHIPVSRQVERALVCVLAVCAAVHAGVVQGVVIEHASGRPMARTRVRLQPVPAPGVDAKIITIRAGTSGHFMFPSVPEGMYLLTAFRDHYFPASYGQRQPSGQGIPFQVTSDSELFAELRMRRMGAITGRVLDENGIGLPGVNVVAYRTRLPLRIAAQAVSDDRGVFRIHGLDPGKYWVRSASHTLDDGTGLLPTFSPESHETRDGRAYAVAVDSEMPDADVRPLQGGLLRLTVNLTCQPEKAPVTIHVSSEIGRRSANLFCGPPVSQVFEGLPPVGYDIYAEMQDGSLAGFVELPLINRDESVGLIMAPPPRVTIAYQGLVGAINAQAPISLTMRRQDPSGPGPEREIKTAQTTLEPGYWEMSARANPGQYVESITNLFGGGSRRSWRRERPADWFEVFIDGRFQTSIKVVVSDKGGTIAGTVQTDGKPVPGIPVFMWPIAEQARRSLRGQLQTLSDVNGQYKFNSLPPGDYRVLATFDLSEADDESMELARAITVHVDPSQTANAPLTPWVAP
jgi:hypothetical protein